MLKNLKEYARSKRARQERLISNNIAARLKAAATEEKEARRVARLEEAPCIATEREEAVLATAREEALAKKDDGQQAMLSARGATSAAIEAAECLLSLGGEQVDLTCLSGPHTEPNSAQTDLSSTIEQLESEVELLQAEVQRFSEQNAVLNLKHPFIDILMSSDQMTKHFTGLPSVDVLKTVYDFVKKYVSIREGGVMTDGAIGRRSDEASSQRLRRTLGVSFQG